MIPPTFPVGTLSGKFLSANGKPIPNFYLRLTATREALRTEDIFYDLGPIYFELTPEGNLQRKKDLEDGLKVIADGFPDQPFHYVAKIGGCGLDFVTFAFRVSPGEVVDVPSALISEVPVEELPEWIAVLEQITDIRNQTQALRDNTQTLRDQTKNYQEQATVILTNVEGVREEVATIHGEVISIRDDLADSIKDDVAEAVQQYMSNNELDYATVGWVNTQFWFHKIDPDPHEAYDNIPSLKLLFENNLI